MLPLWARLSRQHHQTTSSSVLADCKITSAALVQVIFRRGRMYKHGVLMAVALIHQISVVFKQ